MRNFTEYFRNVTERLASQIESSEQELGRPVLYLPSARDMTENIARDFFLSNPVNESLICVPRTLESCRTAKVVGSGKGDHFLKSSPTKCLHYYLYYLDQEFGFMFVKIQTWFPFHIRVYINGRELMKNVFDANGISYECLIKKIPRSRRYHVTAKGGRIMGNLIELRHKDYPKLAGKAA